MPRWSFARVEASKAADVSSYRGLAPCRPLPPIVWCRSPRALFRAGGVPADEAERVAGSLVDANLAGHDSHGMIRIPQYLQAVADGQLQARAFL